MNQLTNEDCAINLSQRPSAATTPNDDSPTQTSYLVCKYLFHYGKKLCLEVTVSLNDFGLASL